MIQPSNSQSELVPLTTRKKNNDGLDEMDIAESVTAIAKCGSTLELHALKDEESLYSAKQMLDLLLPVYDQIESSVKERHVGDGDVEMVGTIGTYDNNGADPKNLAAKRKKMRDAMFDDIPFANSQCQKAWFELCAFVHDDPAEGKESLFRPSASAKLRMWKRILEGSILQSIDLEKQFLVRDLWKATLGEENGDVFMSRGLFNALVRRLSERADGADIGYDTDSEQKCSS